MDPDSLTAAKDCFAGRSCLFGICLLLILSRTDLASSFDQQVMSALQRCRSSDRFLDSVSGSAVRCP